VQFLDDAGRRPAVETTTTDGKPLLRISRRRAALRGWSRASLTPMTHSREIAALTETRPGGNRGFYSPFSTSSVLRLRICV